MGQLASMGNAVGQAGAGGQTGSVAGSFGMGQGAGMLGTILNTAGAATDAFGQYNQYRYAAEMAHQNADAETRAGLINASKAATSYGELENRQRAGFTGQGVGLDSASVRSVTGTTEGMGRLEAGLVQYNSERRAYADLVQASNYKTAATGALVKGAFNVADSFIGGASGLSQKWVAYQQWGGSGAGQTSGAGNTDVPF